MFSTILRLIAITIGCLILGVFAVLAVRSMGQAQSYAPPPHVWFQRPFWGIYKVAPEKLCKDTSWEADLPNAQWIVAIPVERLGARDGGWILGCKPTISLGDFLKRTKHTEFLLMVKAHDTWDLDKLVEIGESFKKNHYAVTADAQKVLIYLRKQAPDWLFAADSASLLRLATYESLYIESAMEFWPDFVISPLDENVPDTVAIDARMAAELERRKKRLIWNMPQSTSADPRIPFQGIMTDRPSAAQQKWSDRL